MSRRRHALALVALALAAVPAGAAAQDRPLGFGINPIGADAHSGYFFFRDARPGRTMHAVVAVGNTNGKPKDILVKAQDATTTGTGGIDFVRLRNGDVGSWLSPRRKTIHLGPRESVRLPITVRVPADAQAGDHFAGVVLYNTADIRRVRKQQASGHGVTLRYISRLAVPVRVRLPGDLVAKVELQRVSFGVTPSGSSIQLTFGNVGNVLIPSSTGSVTVSQDGRRLGRQPMKFTSFLPGTTIDFPVPFKGTPAEATYRITGVLRPQFAPPVHIDRTITFGTKENDRLERATGVTAIGHDEGGGVPWWVWLIVGLFVLGLLLFALLRRRRREEDDERDAAEPPAAPVAAAPAAAPVAAPPPADGARPSINAASVDELARIPGLGPRAAQRIVDHREEYGPFSSWDELRRLEHFDDERVRALSEKASL